MTDNTENYGGEILTAAASCIEIENLGTVETQWGEKNLVELLFEAKLDPEADNRTYLKRTFTLSFHPLSALTGALESWLGRKLAQTERKWSKLKKMEGEECRLLLREKLGSEGEPYLKIQRILPPDQSYSQPEPIEELAFVTVEGGAE